VSRSGGEEGILLKRFEIESIVLIDKKESIVEGNERTKQENREGKLFLYIDS